jgi:preprotein translocase subunit YajC
VNVSNLAALPFLSLPLGFSPPAEGGQSNPFMGFVPIILVLLIFYFLILRPQQRKQRDHSKMLEALAKGDRILTNGGLYATILNVKDNVIVATIADGVKVEISRTAIATKVASKKS